MPIIYCKSYKANAKLEPATFNMRLNVIKKRKPHSSFSKGEINRRKRKENGDNRLIYIYKNIYKIYKNKLYIYINKRFLEMSSQNNKLSAITLKLASLTAV